MRKLFFYFSIVLISVPALQAQKGLNIGISVAGGQVFSKNIAIPKDSPYYLKNDPGLFYGGGLDIAYGFDDWTTIQTGITYGSKQFSLTPSDSLGNTFEALTTTKSMISIPLIIRQRIPIKKDKLYLNIMAGHSLDIIGFDSTVTPTPMAIDSGSAHSRHETVYAKKLIPTVILGAGIDIQSATGNTLNISFIWGIGTGKIVRGEIKEWESLNRDFNPATDEQPNQFPNYYYDFSMRGSYVALRLSYWFNIGHKKNPFEEAEE